MSVKPASFVIFAPGMKKVIIGLGSNLGDRANYLAQARELIGLSVGPISKVSSVIETTSWGFCSSPFLNQIIVVNTILQPIELLDCLESIERKLGRTEKSLRIDGKPVYHDRTIDIDLLDYNHLTWHDNRLTLPHPEIHHRDFIQTSLQELNIKL